MSLGQLCDDNCTITLDKKQLKVFKQDQLIMQGQRSTSGDGLWDIPVAPTNIKSISTASSSNNITTTTKTKCFPEHALQKTSEKTPPISKNSINVIIRQDKSSHDLENYLHAACFSPTKKTFLKAIRRNHLLTWPGLTPDLVNKHHIDTVATAKGHLNQERAGLQSTKKSTPSTSTIEFEMEQDKDYYPPSNNPNLKTNDVIYSLVNTSDKAFLDLTGRFPFCSSRGNQYLLIGYHYDSNAILGAPLKNRQAATITAAWKEINKKLQRAGEANNVWILDNEASDHLKEALTKNDERYQLVPPHTHRANAAERAIQTFKNHFKAGLASLDPDFPVAEWDRLLDQAFLTLNLLRTARINPNLSAHAYLFGNFNFNATPLEPPGTKVVVHSKPDNRASWDANGKEGWYVGYSPHHYRCMKCFMPKTRSEINADTIVFFPHIIDFPKVTPEFFLRQAALDIITILTNPLPSTLPTIQAGDETKNAILQLATILGTNPISQQAWTDQHHSTIKQAAQLPNIIDPPHKVNSTISNTPIQTLQDTLARLARVLKKKELPPAATMHISTDHSFKHKAATFLVNHHQYQSPLQHKTFHIYNAKDKQLTLEEALHSNTSLSPKAYHIFDDNGTKLTLDKVLKGPMQDVWNKSTSNEFGRLAQGNKFGVKFRDVMEFIAKNDLPATCKVTYASFVLDYRPPNQNHGESDLWWAVTNYHIHMMLVHPPQIFLKQNYCSIA